MEEATVKRKFYALSVCAMGILLASCASDIHYDSMSTTASVSFDEFLTSGGNVTILQRFQFDRDLAELSSMHLTEAWISAPILPDGLNDSSETGDYDLSMVNSVGISIMDPAANKSVFWLMGKPASYERENALFKEMNIGDVRNYMDEDMVFEIKISLSIDGYLMTKYWRDICQMASQCTLEFPVSMQFKMED